MLASAKPGLDQKNHHINSLLICSLLHYFFSTPRKSHAMKHACWTFKIKNVLLSVKAIKILGVVAAVNLSWLLHLCLGVVQ